MESVRIKNFRSLKDTNDIQIKPITILVGKNSAGKSSFLRTFPLFKQSVEERTKVPILLYRRNGVDFGSYTDVKNKDSNEDEPIEFSYKIRDVKLLTRYRAKRNGTVSDLSVSIRISRNSDDTPILSSLLIKMFENTIEILFDSQKLLVSNITINDSDINIDEDLSYIMSGFIVDSFFFKGNEFRRGLEHFAIEKMTKLISKKNHSSVTGENIDLMVKRLSVLNYDQEVLKTLKKGFNKYKTWKKNTQDLDTDSEYFKEIYKLVILKNISLIFRTANLYLRDIFGSVKYIAPIRATAERYYRIQDLSVDEVDPYGQNLPMFLGSLTPTMLVKFQLWTQENFSFKVKIKKIEGHYSIKIFYENGFDVNISDIGFGYSQILPIITQLWYSTEKPDRRRFINRRYTPIIFVIEQPELHLHPEFQAKFADVLVKTINNIKERDISIKIIVETHSQTIINRLGENICEEYIDEEDINIVIFDKEIENNHTRVQCANFDNEGLLSNWPIGFFKPLSL